MTSLAAMEQQAAAASQKGLWGSPLAVLAYKACRPAKKC